jgi:hypothetical protein
VCVAVHCLCIPVKLQIKVLRNPCCPAARVPAPPNNVFHIQCISAEWPPFPTPAWPAFPIPPPPPSYPPLSSQHYGNSHKTCHMPSTEPWILEGRQSNELYSMVHPTHTPIYLQAILFCAHTCISSLPQAKMSVRCPQSVLPQQCHTNLSYLLPKILSRHSKRREKRKQKSEIRNQNSRQ